MKNENVKKYLIILFGALLFSAGLNLFIVPVGLYNGGPVGVSQIIRTLVIDKFGLGTTFDFAGIINFILNIPLLYLAYKRFEKDMFFKTLFCIVVQTIFMSVIRIPVNPIISDRLTACLIGGIIVGFGTGIILRAGGSGGGLDILGLYFTKKDSNFSVGKMTLMVNSIIYIVCAFLFELPTAIYSVIFTFVTSFVIDRTHFQAISISVVIFTKQPDLHKKIMAELDRGTTYWKAVGGYTETDTYCIMMVLSRYELIKLQKLLAETDPNCFLVVNGKQRVSGNYSVHL